MEGRSFTMAEAPQSLPLFEFASRMAKGELPLGLAFAALFHKGCTVILRPLITPVI